MSPLRAEPVLRGVTRVRPGTPLEQRCDGRVELDPETGQLIALAAGALRLQAPT
jgi:hypothetical protein